MAPHDEEDDPAVYRSGSSKGKEPQNSTTSTSLSKPKELHDSMDDKQDKEEHASSPSEPYDDDEDDGSTLLSTQPGFNKLLLVLRDEQVMRFVKYVSAAAPGSRWDICGEYEVGMVEEGSNDSESEKS
jgi:prolyl 3-hydroxylase /prolyl 3,4-dihydroxylase